MNKTFNIIDLFFEAAAAYPGKIAIVEKNRQISFADLENEIKLTAAYFRQKGIVKGDRVLVFVPMSIDLYRIVLALFYIGATAVFLDEWVSKQRMDESCRVAKCHVFIGILKARVFAFFSKELRRIPIKLGVNYKQAGSNQFEKAIVAAEDTALITFTTGSTGIPKAAKRTHEILYNQFTSLKEIIEPGKDDVDLCALPIVLLINLAAGCTSVIADYNPRKPELMSARKILAQINHYQITRFVASPFFIKKLAEHMMKQKIAVPSVQKIFTGGAPVFPTDVIKFQAAFQHAAIKAVYGSTEAEPISSINADELAKENQSNPQQGLNTGIPHHQTKVKIIQLTNEAIACANEEELNLICVPAGTIGEIIVNGKHVVREYLHNEDAIRQNKIFVDKEWWHRTGDSGYLSAAGNLYFTGRCNTLIRRNETFIAPLFYENYFQEMKGVEMGTVVEVNSRLIAVVEIKEIANKQMLSDEINQCGIVFDEVKFIKKMPRDPRHFSKIDYEKLRLLFHSV